MKKSPSRSARQHADSAGLPPTLTKQKLEELAHAYLNRFDCTASKLARHLGQRAKKLGDPPDAAAWIAELIERYRRSGVLDDTRFARNLSAQLSARGKSARAISQKLAVRGVPGDVSSELMAARKQQEPGAELMAAEAYARKRRLGHHRPPEQREEYRQKDLASLARQGFSFEIARRALSTPAGSDD
jgi:regulatory protein